MFEKLARQDKTMARKNEKCDAFDTFARKHVGT